TPAAPDSRGNRRRDELGDPALHGLEAGRPDHEVGRQMTTVAEHEPVLGHRRRLDPAAQADAAVGDQLRGTDVNVVARAAADILEIEAGAVLAEVELESSGLQAAIEVRVQPP